MLEWALLPTERQGAHGYVMAERDLHMDLEEEKKKDARLVGCTVAGAQWCTEKRAELRKAHFGTTGPRIPKPTWFGGFCALWSSEQLLQALIFCGYGFLGRELLHRTLSPMLQTCVGTQLAVPPEEQRQNSATNLVLNCGNLGLVILIIIMVTPKLMIHAHV